MAKRKKTEEIVEPVVKEVPEDFMPEPEKVEEEVIIEEKKPEPKVEEVKKEEVVEQPKKKVMIFTPTGPKVRYI